MGKAKDLDRAYGNLREGFDRVSKLTGEREQVEGSESDTQRERRGRGAYVAWVLQQASNNCHKKHLTCATRNGPI